jgi:hypothetical protein
MHDPRFDKLAESLVSFSTSLKKGDRALIDAFDIPAGLITEEFKPGQVVPEVTTWVTVCNLTDHRYAYRTIGDPTPYVVDLSTTDFSTGRRTAIPGPARFSPVTL